MGSFSIPYLKMRNGRPRWEPGPGLRAAGFSGEDLRDEQGDWLDEGAAITRARELNANVAAWRERGQPRRRAAVERRNPNTCAALWDLFKRSPKWSRLAPSTQRDYESKAGLWLATFGAEAVSALRHHHLYAWWETIHGERGHAMANGTVAVARLALSHAVRIGWLTLNPARALAIDGVPPRCVVWSPSEIEAVLAAADQLSVPSIGDAVVIALHTGQRQGDVLSLRLAKVTGGRAVFVQAKTGARVNVPHTPQLEARISAIRNRRRPLAGTVVPFQNEQHVVLDERGQPYTASGFGRVWRDVRAQAARQHKEAASKLFLDLRDTAVTRLALAGCPVPEIRAITGHSMQTVHKVLEHYLALDDRMAQSAITRLRAWMEEEGIAI